MKFLVNLGWIIDLILIAVFIAIPTYRLVLADNYITDPEEVKNAVIMILGGLLVLSPITYVLNLARKVVNRK